MPLHTSQAAGLIEDDARGAEMVRYEPLDLLAAG